MRAITFFVDPRYAAQRGAIASTLVQLLRMAGWQATECDCADQARITYGVGGVTGLPAVEPQAWSEVRWRPTHSSGCVLPAQAVLARRSADPPRLDMSVDWVFASWFFLTGRHELEAEVRQPRRDGVAGADRVPGAGIARWGLLDQAPVERATRWMAEFVTQRVGGVDAARPRWPDGKRWAICLTHDLDRLRRFRPLGFLKEAWRAGRARRPASAAAALGKAVYSSISKPLRADPYLQSLRRWHQFETEQAIPATLFVAVCNRDCAQAAPCDVAYSTADPALAALRRYRDEGAEVALHTSARAWTSAERWKRESAEFQRTFGFEAAGFRAHYLALDPEHPERTLSWARQAGQRYSSTLGLNDVAGFRRGVAYPFQPFDPASGELAGVTEVPLTIMDSAAYAAGITDQQRLDYVRQHLERVRRLGGAAVCDWHTDTLGEPRHQRLADLLLDELAQRTRDAGCWFATLGQVADWAESGRWK